MNVENVRKWIEDLRSGKYRQGRHHLAQQIGPDPEKRNYCCLGVGCVTANIPITEINEEGVIYFDNNDTLPGTSFRRWLGISSIDDLPRIGNLPLWKLNDAAGWSFAEIADLIEEWIENYEKTGSLS